MTKKGLKTSAYRVAVLALVAGLVFSILASITFGNADISIKEVYRVIFYPKLNVTAEDGVTITGSSGYLQIFL